MSDAYWDQTVLLLHCEGANNSTNFWDEANQTAVTAIGDARISTAQKKFGSSSAFFDGAGDYLSISPNTNFDFSTGDFTIEVAIKFDALPTTALQVLGVNGTTGWQIFYGGTASPYLDFNANGAGRCRIQPNPVIGVWYSLIVSRVAGVLYGISNGVLNQSIAFSAAINPGAFPLLVGWTSSYSTYLSGYLDEIRITKGVGRYTNGFVPATAAFDGGPVLTDSAYNNVVLHCHFTGNNNDTTVVDQKGHLVSNLSTTAAYGKISTTTSASRIYGGSCFAILSDAGPYLETVSTDYNLGTGDFTIEFFKSYYHYSMDSATILELRNVAGTGSVLRLEHNSNNSSHYVYINDVLVLTNSQNINNTGLPPPHLAYVRLAGVISLYVNGIKLAASYNSGSASLDGNGVLRLFGGPGRTTAQGYYDDLRITKGLARYTGNFTPPTDPFPDYALQKLTGTVFDAAGNPVAKTVRSYRTSDGLLIDQSVSDATTGAFELRATDTSEHFVVVHDDTKNALVYDHIVPVI